MRRALLTLSFYIVLASPVMAESSPVVLRYQPQPGMGVIYDTKLDAKLDFALGKGAPITGSLQFCMAPSRTTDGSGDHNVVVCVRQGDFSLQGQKWDFAQQALAWTWVFSPERQVRRAEGESPQGLVGILQLILDFVFATEFSPNPVSVGETWETTRTVQAPEGDVLTLSAKHTLLGLEEDPTFGPVADIGSTVSLPVDAQFLGARFQGVFTGNEQVRFSVSDGQVCSVHVTGEATLEGSGVKLVLRDLDLGLVRVGETSTSTVQDWVTQAERNPSLSGSSVTDAVLNANVVKYLRDNWTIYYPRAGYSAPDGFLLGAGAVARRGGKYLVEGSAYLGTSSLRGAYAFGVTRGYPVRPTNQQYFSFLSNAASRVMRLGAVHFDGRRLGSSGIPRMRYSAAMTYHQLLPYSDFFRTAGHANYLTFSATRFRSGASLVERHKLDWEASGSLSYGAGFFGSQYDFLLGDASWVGTVRLSDRASVATRARLTLAAGEVPHQFRTALVDREMLRGYDLASAPLVRHALTASVEYRRHIGQITLPERLGESDWWGAVFADAGIGSNAIGTLLDSRVYLDVGFTIRAGIAYQSIPVYGYLSLAWPLTERNPSPRLSFGMDWAF